MTPVAAVPARSGRAVEPQADFPSAATQPKPWGHEVLFAGGEHGYVGTLSLQYHTEKDETIVVVSGEALLEHGPSAAALTSRTMRPGETVHLPAGVVHRITAVVDLLFAEVSSAAPGWRDDVVRLADRYGRDGTTAP